MFGPSHSGSEKSTARATRLRFFAKKTGQARQHTTSPKAPAHSGPSGPVARRGARASSGRLLWGFGWRAGRVSLGCQRVFSLFSSSFSVYFVVSVYFSVVFFFLFFFGLCCPFFSWTSNYPEEKEFTPEVWGDNSLFSWNLGVRVCFWMALKGFSQRKPPNAAIKLFGGMEVIHPLKGIVFPASQG